MQEFWTYKSERGIPLVYNHAPQKQPVLTVENYCKWYTLYLVMPDGSVKDLPYRQYAHLEGTKGLPILWGDHIIYPPAYERICDELGLIYDHNSADMIAGRWMNDFLDGVIPTP